MECTRCNREVPDEADFCSYCGKPQNTKSARANLKKNNVYVSFHDGRYMFMVCSRDEGIMLDVYGELQRNLDTICVSTETDRNSNYCLFIEYPQNMRTFSAMQTATRRIIKDGTFSRISNILETFLNKNGYTKKLDPNDDAIIYEKYD